MTFDPTTARPVDTTATQTAGGFDPSTAKSVGGPKGYLENPELDLQAYEEAQRRLAARPQGRIGQVLDVVDRGMDNYGFNMSRPFSGLREMGPGGGGFQYGKAIDRYYDEGIQEAAGIPGQIAGVAGSVLSPSPFGKAKLGYQIGEGAVVSGLESLNQSTETDNSARDAAISALTGGGITAGVSKLNRNVDLPETETVGAGQTVDDVLTHTRGRAGVEGLNVETAGLNLREALITDLLGRGGGKKGITRNTKALSTGIPNLKKIIEEDSIPGSVIAGEIMNLGSRAGKRAAARAAANIVDTLGNDASSLASLRAGMLQNVLEGGGTAQTQQRIRRFVDDNTELINQLFTPEQADALAELNTMLGNVIKPDTPEAARIGQYIETVFGPAIGSAIKNRFLRGGQGASALVAGTAGAVAGADPLTTAAAGYIGSEVLHQAINLANTPLGRKTLSATTSRPVGVGRVVAGQAPEALVGSGTEQIPSEEDLRRHFQQQLLQGG